MAEGSGITESPHLGVQSHSHASPFGASMLVLYNPPTFVVDWTRRGHVTQLDQSHWLSWELHCLNALARQPWGGQVLLQTLGGGESGSAGRRA